MLNCKMATRLFSEAQERKLSFKERIALKIHTVPCSGCRNFGEQMNALRSVSRAYAKMTDESAEDLAKPDRD